MLQLYPCETDLWEWAHLLSQAVSRMLTSPAGLPIPTIINSDPSAITRVHMLQCLLAPSICYASITISSIEHRMVDDRPPAAPGLHLRPIEIH